MSFLTSLFTILGSGFIVAIVTQVMANSRTEKEIKRRKLEQIYMDAVKFQNAIFKHFIFYLMFQTGKISPEVVAKLIAEKSDDVSTTFQNLVLTCGIYFPRLAPKAMAILAKEKTFSARGIGSVFGSKGANAESKAETTANAKALRDEFDLFYQEILNEAARINAPFLGRFWKQKGAIQLKDFSTKIDFGFSTSAEQQAG